MADRRRLVALVVVAALLIAAATADASGVTVKHSQTTMHLPRLGHTLVTSNTARVPRHLRDYFGYLQIVTVTGKRTAKARIGQAIVLRDPNGRKLFSLTLLTRYDSTRGRLRVTLRLRNLGVRAYRSKSAVVTALVTIGYKS